MIKEHYEKEERELKIEEAVARRIRMHTHIERAASIRHDL